MKNPYLDGFRKYWFEISSNWTVWWLKEILKDISKSLWCTMNFFESVEFIRLSWFDLLVLHLVWFQQYSELRKIRQNKENNWLFIWVVTDKTKEDLIKNLIDIWVDDILRFPISIGRFESMVRRYSRLKENNLEMILKDLEPQKANLIRQSWSLMIDTFTMIKTWKIEYWVLRENWYSLLKASQDENFNQFISNIKSNWKLYSHSLRFASLIRYICYNLWYDQEVLKDVFLWWILHDIWLLYYEKDLNLILEIWIDEFEIYHLNESHISKAKEILQNNDSIPQIARDVILFHHERFDWKWPNRLKWIDIPEIWRIAAIVDYFCTLKWPFLYRNVLTSTNHILDKISKSDMFDQQLFSKIRDFF